MLGHAQLWPILSRAFDLSKSQNHAACFSSFWKRLKVTAAQSCIVLAQDGSVQCPRCVFLPRAILNPFQAKALQEIGGRIVIEELRPYQTAMNQLGAPILTLERMVNLLEKAMDKQGSGANQVSEQRLENFHRPLWSVVHDLLPEGVTPNPVSNPSVQKLLSIPFIVTEDLFLVTLQPVVSGTEVPGCGECGFNTSKACNCIPPLADFPRIACLIRQLELGSVASQIHLMCALEPVEDVIGVNSNELRDLYALFSDLDRAGNVDKAVYQTLRNLPIWLSSRGLIRATQALLPGNFTDPTGEADLLDVTVLTDSSRDFISSRLGVQTQTIEAFVRTVLPRFFNDDGPLDEQKYPRLIAELANHSSLVNDENMSALLGALALAPTQDGRWSRTYQCIPAHRRIGQRFLGMPRICGWTAVESRIPVGQQLS